MTDLTQRGRRRPNTGRAALLAVAITAVVAGAGALAYVVGWGIADGEHPATATTTASVEQQLQCTTIKREYDAWHKAAGLENIDRLRGKATSIATKNAVEEAEALQKAIDGYKDKPTLELAVAVGNYSFELGLLNLQATASGDYRDVNYQDTMAARGNVYTAFNNFWAKTCS